MARPASLCLEVFIPVDGRADARVRLNNGAETVYSSITRFPWTRVRYKLIVLNDTRALLTLLRGEAG